MQNIMEKFFKNLSLQALWKFINCIITTAPLCLWLAILSFIRNWKTFLSNPAVRLFCIFAIVDLSVKFYKMIASGYFERRYMLPFLCILIIFAADGLLNKLAPFLYKRLGGKINFLSLSKITVGLISILFIIYFIIIMIPSLDHPWYHGIRTLVQQECPKGKKPIILSNDSDARLGYYANSELFVFSIKDFKLSNNVRTYRKTWSTNKLIQNLPSGIDNFTKNVKALGGSNVFIFLYDMKDSEFRKLFKQKHLKFPFKLLSKYNARHNKPVCFYKF